MKLYNKNLLQIEQKNRAVPGQVLRNQFFPSVSDKLKANEGAASGSEIVLRKSGDALKKLTYVV